MGQVCNTKNVYTENDIHVASILEKNFGTQSMAKD